MFGSYVEMMCPSKVHTRELTILLKGMDPDDNRQTIPVAVVTSGRAGSSGYEYDT